MRKLNQALTHLFLVTLQKRNWRNLKTGCTRLESSTGQKNYKLIPWVICITKTLVTINKMWRHYSRYLIQLKLRNINGATNFLTHLILPDIPFNKAGSK